MSAPPPPAEAGTASISMRERSILSVLRRFSERNPGRAFPFETHPAYFREVAVKHGLATARAPRAGSAERLSASEAAAPAAAPGERTPEVALGTTQPAAVRDLASGRAEAGNSSTQRDPTSLGVPLVAPDAAAQAPVALGGVPGLVPLDAGAGASALGTAAPALGQPAAQAALPGLAAPAAAPRPTPAVYTQGVLAGTARLDGPATDLHAPPTAALQAQVAPPAGGEAPAAGDAGAAPAAPAAPGATLSGAGAAPPPADSYAAAFLQPVAEFFRRLAHGGAWQTDWRTRPSTRRVVNAVGGWTADATGNSDAGQAVRLVKQLREAQNGRTQLELMIRWYYRAYYVISVLRSASVAGRRPLRVVTDLLEDGVNGPRGVNAPELTLRATGFGPVDEPGWSEDAARCPSLARTLPGATHPALTAAVAAAWEGAPADARAGPPEARTSYAQSYARTEALAGVRCEAVEAAVLLQRMNSQRPSAAEWAVLMRVTELMQSWSEEPQSTHLLSSMREVPWLRQLGQFSQNAAATATAATTYTLSKKLGAFVLAQQPWLTTWLAGVPAVVAGGVGLAATLAAATYLSAGVYQLAGQTVSLFDPSYQEGPRPAPRATTFFTQSFATDVFFTDVNETLARTGLGADGQFARALASLQVEIGDPVTYEVMQSALLDVLGLLSEKAPFVFENEAQFVQYFHGFLYQPVRMAAGDVHALHRTGGFNFDFLADLFPAELGPSLAPSSVSARTPLDLNPITGHQAMGGLRGEAGALTLENCFFFPYGYETTPERLELVQAVRAEYGERELRGVEWSSVPTWSGVYASDFLRRLYALKLAKPTDTRPDPPDLPNGQALQLGGGNSEVPPGQPNLAAQDTTGGLDPRGIEIALARVQAQRQKLAEKYYDGTSESVDPALTARGAQKLPPARSHPLFRVDGYRRYEGDDPSNPLAIPRAAAERTNAAEAAEVIRAEAAASTQPPAKNSALLNSPAYQAAIDSSSYNTASYFRPARVRYELRDDAHTTEPTIDLRSHDVQQQRLARLQPPEPERDFSAALPPPKRQRHALWADEVGNPRADARAKLAHFLRQ